jgi:putative DNA primase/helicase
MSTAGTRPHCAAASMPYLIPDDLKERDQWVLWRYEPRNGRLTKVPYQPGEVAASSTDPTSWRSYLEVCEEYAQYADFCDGIGFVFAADDSITGTDLDDCLDDEGRLKPWATPIVEKFGDTYIEVSPGGEA